MKLNEKEIEAYLKNNAKYMIRFPDMNEDARKFVLRKMRKHIWRKYTHTDVWSGSDEIHKPGRFDIICMDSDEFRKQDLISSVKNLDSFCNGCVKKECGECPISKSKDLINEQISQMN